MFPLCCPLTLTWEQQNYFVSECLLRQVVIHKLSVLNVQTRLNKPLKQHPFLYHSHPPSVCDSFVITSFHSSNYSVSYSVTPFFSKCQLICFLVMCIEDGEIIQLRSKLNIKWVSFSWNRFWVSYPILLNASGYFGVIILGQAWVFLRRKKYTLYEDVLSFSSHKNRSQPVYFHERSCKKK